MSTTRQWLLYIRYRDGRRETIVTTDPRGFSLDTSWMVLAVMIAPNRLTIAYPPVRAS
jgi:hypothetical protein